MARPKRNAARQCNDKMKRALEEELLDKSMGDDDDNVVIATVSSSSANDAGTSPVLRRGRSRRSLDVLEETARTLWALEPSPLKPQTPQKTSVLTKRPRASPTEVVEIESDSSDEFVVDDLSSDDDSDVGRGRRKVEIDVLDTDSDEMEARPRSGRGKKPPSKRVKRRSRGRRAVQDPAQKLQWQVSDEEWEEQWGNATDADFNDLKFRKLPLEQGEAPAELLMPLLPFQKEWLAWSLKQEAGIMRGGILADEMGMGKTIQAISLIVAGRRREPVLPNVELNTPVRSNHASNSSSSQTPLPRVKATLVICPLVAVIQWRNEVQRFTAPGSVKVLVYHGPRRSIGLDVLAGYDIILTTYSVLEVEHRKHVLPPKDPCKWCGKLYYAERMAIHLRYYCGPEAHRTSKQAKQEKRKAPSKLHSKVVDIEDSETDSEVDVVKRKGPKKGRSVKSAKKKCIADIDEDVELSKGQVSSKSKSGRGCYRKIAAVQLQDALGKAVDTAAGPEMASTSKNLQGKSILHSVRWQRIVLDEAHSIKDRKSSTAKAAFALQAEYKWALSGTPLQNRVGELYSLIRFLGIHPFSYYFCRKCDCKSLDYQFQVFGQKSACSCGHSPLHHFCWWNKFIANPIKRKGYVEEGQKAMRILKQKVLSNTLLRRTKLERAADLALPPRTAFLRRDMFDAKEQDFYQALYTQSQSQFNGYVNAGTLVNNYAHIFDLLTRLRQAVDHPYLVVYSATSIKDAPQFDLSGGDSVCGLCHEPAEDPLTTGCQHSFCRLCIDGYIAAAELSSQCPKCQKLLTIDFSGTKASQSGHAQHLRETGVKKSSILNRIDLRQFQTSTKIEAVKEEIYFMLKKDPAAKAIVFSQFTSMLDLIGFSLKKSGIRYVKLDGSMNLAARDQMIEAFTNDVDTKIFLMSLKAGGVALNLTVASHVFLMDPWWNPAVEQQAQDRIHRIGQFKPIRVTRFVIENTIEERILKLQEKKQLVFEGTVGGSSDALGRLTEEDLRFLFTN